MFLRFHFADEFVQAFESRLEEFASRFDPFRFRFQAALPERAGSYPSDLVRDDEPGPLEDLDVLGHAGQRHLECFRQIGDRRVGAAELIDDPAAGWVGQGREGAIEGGVWTLNHVVQCLAWLGGERKGSDDVWVVAGDWRLWGVAAARVSVAG